MHGVQLFPLFKSGNDDDSPGDIPAGIAPFVLEVRGEVYMTRAGFEQLNKQRIARGEEAFANARTRGLITDSEQNQTINTFLTAQSAQEVGHEKGDTLTTLTSTQKTLVYPVRLEHH